MILRQKNTNLLDKKDDLQKIEKRFKKDNFET